MEKVIVAMRGRYVGGEIVQHLEWNHTNVCNSLTTVQKDNLLLEMRNNENRKNRTDGQHD